MTINLAPQHLHIPQTLELYLQEVPYLHQIQELSAMNYQHPKLITNNKPAKP